MTRPQQLPLRVILRDDARFDNFYVGDNTQLFTLLQTFSESFIYFFGPTASGRTHLLQAVCHRHHFFYLPLSQYKTFSPRVLEALEEQIGVTIDDIDAVMGNREWEEALFCFYNRACERKTKLVISGNTSPLQLNCFFSDLKSRLSSTLIFSLLPLSDEQKSKALQYRAKLRGLSLTDEVTRYLVHHYSRDMHDLLEMLERLDQASLIEKRKITIPLVKRYEEVDG